MYVATMKTKEWWHDDRKIRRLLTVWYILAFALACPWFYNPIISYILKFQFPFWVNHYSEHKVLYGLFFLAQRCQLHNIYVTLGSLFVYSKILMPMVAPPTQIWDKDLNRFYFYTMIILSDHVFDYWLKKFSRWQHRTMQCDICVIVITYIMSAGICK